MAQPQGNPKTKKPAGDDGDGDVELDEDLDDDDDDAEGQEDLDPSDLDSKSKSNGAELTDNEKSQEATEAKRQARIAAFLKDPEQSMAVFLSSYYREKGMVWFVLRFALSPQ